MIMMLAPFFNASGVSARIAWSTVNSSLLEDDGGDDGEVVAGVSVSRGGRCRAVWACVIASVSSRFCFLVGRVVGETLASLSLPRF